MSIYQTMATDETYAYDVQEAIFSVMEKYRKSVGFEAQMAIIGVAIGSILNQLPDYDREHYTRVLIRNIEDAENLAVPITLQ